jgi:hypothetical protein
MLTMLNCTFCKESFDNDAKWYAHIMKHIMEPHTTVKSVFEALTNNLIYSFGEV